ncbi:MAG: hypothetical protein OCC49_15925 [Fibrobacterales bacterium]
MKSRMLFTFIIAFMFVQSVTHAKKILLIESYHEDYQWSISVRKGLLKELSPSDTLISFCMDTKRLPADQFQSQADSAWAQYEKTNPTLVVLADDNALKYLGERLATTRTPVIYLGINNNPRNYLTKRHMNITGVLERPLLKRSIRFLYDIYPSKKILILLDSGLTSNIMFQEVFDNTYSQTLLGAQIDVVNTKDFSHWKETVVGSKKKGYDAIILALYQSLFHKEKHIPSNAVMEWMQDNSPVPMFGFWDFSISKNGAIGGYVLFGETQGRAAGKMIVKIFNGAQPGSLIPETPEKGTFLFSRKQLKKWNITLPKYISDSAQFID